jgi:hypothetical protein
MRRIGPVVITLGIVAAALAPGSGFGDDVKQAAIVAGEVATFAHQLSLRPDVAIDLTKVSGEYCFNTGLGSGFHMTHYATDPTKTQEDVIDFVNAEPLIKAGVNVSALPKFPGGLNTMTPGQWYYIAAGEPEPHHGTKFPFPLLIRATNIK